MQEYSVLQLLKLFSACGNGSAPTSPTSPSDSSPSGPTQPLSSPPAPTNEPKEDAALLRQAEVLQKFYSKHEQTVQSAKKKK